MPLSFLSLFLAFCLLVTAVCAHEAGHWFYFWLLGKKVDIAFKKDAKGKYCIIVGKRADYLFLNRINRISLSIYGICFGTVILSIGGLAISGGAFLLVPYFLWCIPDFKIIWRAWDAY